MKMNEDRLLKYHKAFCDSLKNDTDRIRTCEGMSHTLSRRAP